ncbi:MAG: pantetheine-phosphate adenylyltransferase [Spirochaetales bacterium]|nr:pantetheine-phosphate adenylyltransferase [Spirochaetales bacterium]
MGRAVYPGSFDPPTCGHLDVIRRATAIFGGLDVLVAINPERDALFTPEERRDLLLQCVEEEGIAGVNVHCRNGFATEYCQEVGAEVIVRGVRDTKDFEAERQMAWFNHRLGKGIETIFLPASPHYLAVSASGIRHVAAFGGNLEGLVPSAVIQALKNFQN